MARVDRGRLEAQWIENFGLVPVRGLAVQHVGTNEHIGACWHVKAAQHVVSQGTPGEQPPRGIQAQGFLQHLLDVRRRG